MEFWYDESEFQVKKGSAHASDEYPPVLKDDFTWNDSPCICSWFLSDPLQETFPLLIIMSNVKRHMNPIENIWIVDICVNTWNAYATASSTEWCDS